MRVKNTKLHNYLVSSQTRKNKKKKVKADVQARNELLLMTLINGAMDTFLERRFFSRVDIGLIVDEDLDCSEGVIDWQAKNKGYSEI